MIHVDYESEVEDDMLPIFRKGEVWTLSNFVPRICVKCRSLCSIVMYVIILFFDECCLRWCDVMHFLLAFISWISGFLRAWNCGFSSENLFLTWGNGSIIIFGVGRASIFKYWAQVGCWLDFFKEKHIEVGLLIFLLLLLCSLSYIIY